MHVSDPALCLHGGGDFLEAREVRAGKQVAFDAIALGGLLCLRVAAVHDALQALVDFLEGRTVLAIEDGRPSVKPASS